MANTSPEKPIDGVHRGKENSEILEFFSKLLVELSLASSGSHSQSKELPGCMKLRWHFFERERSCKPIILENFEGSSAARNSTDAVSGSGTSGIEQISECANSRRSGGIAPAVNCRWQYPDR